jgi:hypothetical protein
MFGMIYIKILAVVYAGEGMTLGMGREFHFLLYVGLFSQKSTHHSYKNKSKGASNSEGR